MCGTCVEACPSGAREMIGHNVTVNEILAELLKDRAYYEKSGGGVTLSGGEPTLQPDFSEALLRGLKAQSVSTALDTCGLCSQGTLDRLLPYTDLVLFADHNEYRTFRDIDGTRTIAQLGREAAGFVERLWRHDLVALDTTAGSERNEET